MSKDDIWVNTITLQMICSSAWEWCNNPTQKQYFSEQLQAKIKPPDQTYILEVFPEISANTQEAAGRMKAQGRRCLCFCLPLMTTTVVPPLTYFLGCLVLQWGPLYSRTGEGSPNYFQRWATQTLTEGHGHLIGHQRFPPVGIPCSRELVRKHLE